MKEEEAKTKWCPHARYNGDNMNDIDFAKCIASDCMMWQEYKDMQLLDYMFIPDETEWECLGAVGDGYQRVWISKKSNKNGGYCGLAK